MTRITGIAPALLGSALLAVLSTLGDFIWDRWIRDPGMIHGVVHGAVIFAAIGLVLGLAAGGGRLIGRGIAGQTLIGIGVSASFYPLYRLLGIAALFITWMALWLLTALLDRWLHQRQSSLREALLRGLAAAVLSGLAFWSISGIWTRPDPEGPQLLRYLASWLWAFLPGFAAIFCRFRSVASARPG